MNKKLENRIARLEKAVKSNHKSTLERRITRLENAVKSDSHQVRRKKFESFESDLDVDRARAAANRIAQRFGRMMDANVRPDDLGDDVIDSPRYGWLSVDRTDEITDDPEARFVFQYTLGSGFSILVVPSDNAVELMTDDGYAVDPSGEMFEADTTVDGSFPLSDWKDFDLSMVNDEDEDY